MERKVVLVCGTVGFLGLLAAVLGFAAEAKRIKISDVVTGRLGQCFHPRSPALFLGLASAVAVTMAQAVLNFSAGCICCRRNLHISKSNWTVGLICFILSWATFIIAFLLLMTGAALNDKRNDTSLYFGDYCYAVKAGVFSGAAVLSLASVSLGIIYYFALQTAKNAEFSHAQGIALSPLQSTQPAFVHEDTYYRQTTP